MAGKVSFDSKIVCAVIGSELPITVRCSSPERNKSQHFIRNHGKPTPTSFVTKIGKNEAHRQKVSKLVTEQTETQIA